MARTKGPNAIDIHVGSRMRMRRMMLGMSQEKLADGFGLTFQQVQKYEKGTNRMGASRLQQAADILGSQCRSFSKGSRTGLSSRTAALLAGLYRRVRHQLRWPSVGEGVHARTACLATLYRRSRERDRG